MRKRKRRELLAGWLAVAADDDANTERRSEPRVRWPVQCPGGSSMALTGNDVLCASRCLSHRQGQQQLLLASQVAAPSWLAAARFVLQEERNAAALEVPAFVPPVRLSVRRLLEVSALSRK